MVRLPVVAERRGCARQGAGPHHPAHQRGAASLGALARLAKHGRPGSPRPTPSRTPHPNTSPVASHLASPHTSPQPHLTPQAKNPDLIDGHGLQTLYGDKYKQKLEFGAFGVKSLRELLDKCSKLKPKMKNDKMYVRCTCCGPAGIHGAATPEPKAAAQKAEGASSVREAKRAATAKRARDGDEEAAVVVKKKVDTRKVKKSK